jgi:uncharacterized protein YydD (DUF2326 family)
MATAAQEIALMKRDIETLSSEVKELNEKIDNLMIKLLDPDEGIVIRVNKNTERLNDRDKNMGRWMKDIEDFHHMKRWKNTVTKALWVIYTGIIGFVIKLVFWD